ncbi:hypothetical protein NDU88_004561 [Pleurodeles waltl]|uniref:Uncharacterized protein n=1 Tax=Pleurodeles waltl TaxID=8319 RepID=A0AAV7M9K8_PLEWA|nr:hypothetical protein NDU88_004561 [Pleurodeles waltl]
MRVFSRLVMAQPKAKGFGWKEPRTMVGSVDVPLGPVPIRPDLYPSAPPVDTIKLTWGVVAANTAIHSPPMRLITSFYQKMDTVPSLRQVAKQPGQEEPAATQGCAPEEEDVGRELCSGSTEGAAAMRVDEDVKTSSLGPLSIEPTCQQTFEQPHKKKCLILKSQQSEMDSSMEESELMTWLQGRKEHEALLHGCLNRELMVLNDNMGGSERRGNATISMKVLLCSWTTHSLMYPVA